MTPADVGTLRGLFFTAGFIALLGSELIRSYRPPTVAKTNRLLINLSLAGLNAAVLHFLFTTATVATALYVTKNHTGILNQHVGLPSWLKLFFTILLMDFLIYTWHLLNHNLPLLWRFHRVHHSDMNMDVSTAVRFHIGELAVSGVIKLKLVSFLGMDIVSLCIFDSIFTFASQLNHSSIKLPACLERALWTILVPPSMHRIHHSVKIAERNTNYGTILSVWDRIFGTLVKDIDQASIIIGIGAYREPNKLSFFQLLWQPFTAAVK